MDRNEEVRNKEPIDWCENLLKSRNDQRSWANKVNSLLNIRIEEKKSFFLNE
ncbi:MAG: hypothetical protein ACE5SW_07240 [Nitrososphaeraceae archaeon]